MKMNRSVRSVWAQRIVAALVFSVLSAEGRGHAHHSFAMYDPSKPMTITGVVKELQWTNPHVLLWVTRDPEPGQKEGTIWLLELSTSTGPLARLGWTKRSVVPGDRVIVDLNPLRSGKPGGQFKKLTIVKTGQVLLTAVPDTGGKTPDAGPGDKTASDAGK